MRRVCAVRDMGWCDDYWLLNGERRWFQIKRGCTVRRGTRGWGRLCCGRASARRGREGWIRGKIMMGVVWE
jgi:hypothetical protein